MPVSPLPPIPPPSSVKKGTAPPMEGGATTPPLPETPVVAGGVIPGFTGVESRTIHEARAILNSPEMSKVKAAHAAGDSVTVNIGGRVIQYEPGLPASGMTMFGENGFLIGREAFASEAELNKTVLHELHRLNTSASSGGVSGDLATEETQAAFDFAERANQVIEGKK